MPNYVDKKWYTGSLVLWPNDICDLSQEHRILHKYLIQKRKNRTIVIIIADVNNLITLHHLRLEQIRVYGRFVKLSDNYIMSLMCSTPYYLETEKIQLLCDNTLRTSDEFVNWSLPQSPRLDISAGTLLVGKLVSMGPMLAVSGDDEETGREECHVSGTSGTDTISYTCLRSLSNLIGCVNVQLCWKWKYCRIPTMHFAIVMDIVT